MSKLDNFIKALDEKQSQILQPIWKTAQHHFEKLWLNAESK